MKHIRVPGPDPGYAALMRRVEELLLANRREFTTIRGKCRRVKAALSRKETSCQRFSTGGR